MLDRQYCLQRQKRLLDVMHDRQLDAVALGASEHVYYFTGFRAFWLHSAGMVMLADGRAVLVAAGKPDAALTAANVHLPFDASWMCTNRQEQPMVVAAQLAQTIKNLPTVKSVGIDASAVSSQLAVQLDVPYKPVDADLWQLRRRKDPDELLLMKRAIRCTQAMYERAKEVIEPGIPEITVFTELQAAAVASATEPLSAMLGNDFACATQGGPARAGRVAASGELYILDLGPAVRGYFSDNCRTFAVDRKLTDAQHEAWEIVVGAIRLIESTARAGVRCRHIFSAVDDYYRSKTGTAFPHHLGHGVGLQPHEFPHLNPHWDDTLQENEIISCEPGMYRANLHGGLRIENQYRVTIEGLDNLTPFPTELTW